MMKKYGRNKSSTRKKNWQDEITVIFAPFLWNADRSRRKQPWKHFQQNSNSVLINYIYGIGWEPGFLGTYVEPRKKASERWNPKRNTDTIAVRSIATEVEYTCRLMESLRILNATKYFTFSFNTKPATSIQESTNKESHHVEPATSFTQLMSQD